MQTLMVCHVSINNGRANEHPLKFCEDLEQKPNFARTFFPIYYISQVQPLKITLKTHKVKPPTTFQHITNSRPTNSQQSTDSQLRGTVFLQLPNYIFINLPWKQLASWIISHDSFDLLHNLHPNMEKDNTLGKLNTSGAKWSLLWTLEGC